MRVRCDYCGTYMEDTDKVCSNCGAPNPALMRSGTDEPKTIAQLKDFCQDHHLPLEKMRFFIGQNFKEPKAFGIYQDESGQFIVYKNKADGQRVIRYRGDDEAFAVNEIYQKMRTEMNQRRDSGKLKGNGSVPPPPPSGNKPEEKKKKSHPFLLGIGLFALIFIGASFFAILNACGPDTGYYEYQDQNYYNLNGSWYIWDDSYEDWYLLDSVDDELTSHHEDYYCSSDYSPDYGTSDFQDTVYYSDYLESSTWDDDDWDDDDWDWDDDDDWDYNDTDWDDDW